MTRPADRLFARVLLASGAVVAAALLTAALLLTGPSRVGAVAGLAVAGLSGALALALLRRSAGRPVQALLGAIVTSFLSRMVLVGLGLVAAIRLWSQATALPFAVAFFSLFFLLQGLEFVYARRALKAEGAPTS